MNPLSLAETERLILRRYHEQDLFDLFEILSDPLVVEYEPYRVMTLDEVNDNLIWRISSLEMIAVQLKSSSKMIGNIYLAQHEDQSMELGFVFNRSYWGKGYAKEACQAMINQAFSKGILRIEAHCDPINVNSWHLLEALGFVREAHWIKNVYFFTDEDGQPLWKDTYDYALYADQSDV